MPVPVARARRAGARALVLLLVAALAGASCGAPEVARIGSTAPGFSGTALDGSMIDLERLRGRPVVVNFWASWCGPCRTEFPLLAERAAALGPADGLVVIGVLYKDDPELARRFVEEAAATWPSLPDDGTIATAYGVVAPPQTYFIDPDGVLRGIQVGEIRAEDFARQYAKIAP